MIRVLFFSVLLILSSRAQIVLKDESLTGDISDDYLSPTTLTAVEGDNRVIGSLNGSNTDLDLFTLIISTGYQLQGISLVGYSTGGSIDNEGFFGVQPGSTLSREPSNSFSDPIGYVLYGYMDLGINLLPTMANGPPFWGLNPFPSGEYAFWLNETSSASTYEWSFDIVAIPEPSSTMIVVSAMSFGLLIRKRR